MTSQKGSKQMQNTYCPISHEKKQSENEIWSVNGI